MRQLYVIGSINMDLVVGVERFPAPGETLTGTRFATVPGGKGANQAVALARLGAQVGMVGRVGRDGFGDAYLRHLEAEGVVASLVERSDAATGVALIEVDARGENHIVVVPGANHAADAGWMERALARIPADSIVLMQLEIPMESVLTAARHISAGGGTLILDPAPMQPMPDELLRHARVITPNEHELRALTLDMPNDASMEERILDLRRRGARCVLHKRGAEGAYLLEEGKEEIEHIPAFDVKAVDTTAAGDSFNAGFAYGLTMDLPIRECARVACAVGGLAATRFGAQAGMPTVEEVRQLIINN